MAFLKEKSEAFKYFKTLKNVAESESGKKIKFFRTHRGGEFNSQDFISHCEVNGIKRQFSD